MGEKNEKELAIEKILIENYEMYYRLAYSYVHNEADSLDIVQEGAYKAILNSDSLRNVEYAKTWVYRIMLNEVFGLYRRQSRIDSNSCECISEQLPDFRNDVNMESVELRDALMKLSQEDRTVIELRYYYDMKLKDISKVMNVNLSTTKSRFYRAVDKLKVVMNE